MLRVVADSNTYISALEFGGPPLELLRRAEGGLIRLIASDHIMEEVTRTLGRKFDWPEDQLQELHKMFSELTERVHPVMALDAVRDDPDDNRILECALAGNAEFVVTGDKDLLRLRQHGKIRILLESEFLETA